MLAFLQLDRPEGWPASPSHVNQSSAATSATWQYEKWDFQSEALQFVDMGRKYVNDVEEAYQAFLQGGDETTIIEWDWGPKRMPERREGLQYLARGHTCQNKI